MAFSAICRRGASAVASLANRAGRARSHSTLITSSVKSNFSREIGRRTSTIFPSHFSSTAEKRTSDKELLRIIDDEIKCTEETDDHDRVDEIPDYFPFELQDNPGKQTVSLKREYHGETIKVEVHMPDFATGDEDDNDGDDNNDDSDDNGKDGQSSIPLVVTVLKSSKPCLEFTCTAYPDEVTIESMSIRDPEASQDEIGYEGPDFADLDENLQKAFHKYLEIRGIKPSVTNFLHEYMINKDSREYLMWLKNLKEVVAQ